MSLNSISITGRIAKEVELRFSKDGLALVDLSLYTYQGKGDTKKTTWYDVVFFGKQAEIIGQWFKNKDNIVITGKIIEVSAYLKKADGQPAATIKVKGLDFGFVDKQEEKADEGF